MTIATWLEKFKQNWKNGNIDSVLEMFADDVDYYETPSTKLETEEIRREWNEVTKQEDIKLDTEIFSSEANKHTVQWHLTYVQNGEKTELKGIYLIKLDENGKCTEFWQYCQSE